MHEVSSSQEWLTALKQFLVERFRTTSSLQLLCGRLGLSSADLVGETLRVKLEFLAHHYVVELERTEELLDAIEAERPGLLAKHGLI